MEINENTPWFLMLLIAVALGLRHGLDLDHIATIDAITRTARKQQSVSRLTGFFFSFGHGIVVTAISLVIGAGIIQAQVPEWLDGVGAWVSIFFLLAFGFLNLWNVFQNNSSEMPVGIKSFVTQKIMNKKYNPAMIMIVGALFAFSFDTFSQIALFSISATLMSGWLFSGILGVCFSLGMIITDGINGLLVSSIVQRADKGSLIFSRCLGLAISGLSLGIGIFALFRLFQ
jgi:high-affinity nickel-transport protein